jgi:hypothetical protein
LKTKKVIIKIIHYKEIVDEETRDVNETPVETCAKAKISSRNSNMQVNEFKLQTVVLF